MNIHKGFSFILVYICQSCGKNRKLFFSKFVVSYTIMSITKNLEEITRSLPTGVKLIAVSKTKPVSDIEEAWRWGQRAFGENKVQELVGKYEALPKDIEWHMIGHLQTNKVKYIIPFVKLIHGVDRGDLLAKIDREAGKVGRVVDCLIQFHIAEEETKFGLSEEEANILLESDSYREMRNVRITGVMGMATFTDDPMQVHQEFRHLKDIFSRLKQRYFAGQDYFQVLSMGMSEDYRIAVEEGSTMVRIGSSIFGRRNYNTESRTL